MEPPSQLLLAAANPPRVATVASINNTLASGITTSSNTCGNNETAWSQPFNSSGTVDLDVSAIGISKDLQPWKLTVALKDAPDSRSQDRGKQTLNSYLSVPDALIDSAAGNATRFCLYWFTDISAKAKGDNGSCEGVLDPKCTKFLDDFIKTADISGNECPGFGFHEDYPCKGTISTTIPNNFSSRRCDEHQLGGVNGIPENYTTRGFFGIGFLEGDKEKDSFKVYDSHVTQSTPLLALVGYENSTSNASPGELKHASKYFCITPNDVADGSRQPPSFAVELRANKCLVAVAAAASVLLTYVL